MITKFLEELGKAPRIDEDTRFSVVAYDPEKADIVLNPSNVEAFQKFVQEIPMNEKMDTKSQP